jgi:hypothetical protein
MFSLPPFYLSCYNTHRLKIGSKPVEALYNREAQPLKRKLNSSGYASIAMPINLRLAQNLLSETIKI